jgi:hypothetical protein
LVRGGRNAIGRNGLDGEKERTGAAVQAVQASNTNSTTETGAEKKASDADKLSLRGDGHGRCYEEAIDEAVLKTLQCEAEGAAREMRVDIQWLSTLSWGEEAAPR